MKNTPQKKLILIMSTLLLSTLSIAWVASFDVAPALTTKNFTGPSSNNEAKTSTTTFNNASNESSHGTDSNPLATSALKGAITLVYSADLMGEIEPCGCTIDTDYGGIQRRVTQVDALREVDPNLVLFSAGNIFNLDASSKNIINRYIASGFALLNYDAIATQSKDLNELHMGSNTSLNILPWIGNSKMALDEKAITRGETKLFFFNLSSTASPAQANTLAQRLEEINQANTSNTVVILSLEAGESHSNLIQSLIDKTLVNILIQPKSDEYFDEPEVLGKTLVLHPGHRGMRLGVVRFSSNAPTINFDNRVIELDNTIADAPRTKQWYENYNQALIDYFAADSATKSAENSPYVGEATCKACHQSSHETWSTSRHASAIETLRYEGKTEDPNCIGCHVAGYQIGGYINAEKTPHLANVQCEACHGAAKAHSQAPLNEKPANHSWAPEQMCAQCHVKDHSPKFNYETYWPKIKHGKE